MAKDNDGLLISAGLDISQTLVNIQKDIQKLNIELKNDKNARARIVGELNLAETTRLINANLETVSKGLKLDIGNVNIGNAANSLTSNLGNAAGAAKDISSSLNNINNEANNANISAKALGRTLADIDERFVKPVKPVLDPDGIINAEKTIERFENKFKSLGSVNVKAIYNDNASADSLAKIEVAVKSTTGEIRNLTFELDKAAQKFEYISSTYSDKGMFKNTSKNSTLQSTLDFLNRIEQRMQTINSRTLNQANPLKEGTEYYSNYNRQLQITAQRIDEITSKNRILSDEQKREIGMMVSYLQNYAKEQQKLAYPPMISSTDVGAQIQIATANLEKLKTQWSGQGVLIDSVQKRIDGLFAALSGIGDTEGLKKFHTDLAILKNDVSSISAMNEYLSKGLNEIRRLGSNSVFKKNSGNADVQASITKLNELQEKYRQFQQALSTAKSPEEIQKIGAALTQIKPQFDSVISSAKNLQASLKDTNGAEKHAQKLRVLISQIEQFMAANTKAMRSNKTLGSGNTVAVELNNMLTALRANADPEKYQEIAANFRVVRNEVKMLGIEGKTMWGTFVSGLKKFGNWFGVSTLFMRVAREIRGLFTDVAELDTALVDLRKTFKGTDAELKQFYYDANDVAKQLGVTTKEVIEQASAWSRLGFSSEKSVKEMAKYSSMFASISPDMDTDAATNGLVSIIKAYDIEVDDVLDGILSKINSIGNTAATSNGEIVNMLLRSSSAMKEANNTLEETIALETAAVEITRDAESVGTAYKTLSMRLRGYDEEVEAYTNDVEELSGDIADLTKTAKTPGGISLFTDAAKTEFKSTYQLLKEISVIYDELDDKTQAQLLEVMAGKRQGQIVAATLKNFSAAEKALETMAGSQGSALAEMEVIMDSVDYKANEFKETLVGIAQDSITQDFLKTMIESGTKLLETISDAAPVLNTLLSLFGGVTKAAAGLVDTIGLLPSIMAGLSLKNIGEIYRKHAYPCIAA